MFTHDDPGSGLRQATLLTKLLGMFPVDSKFRVSPFWSVYSGVLLLAVNLMNELLLNVQAGGVAYFKQSPLPKIGFYFTVLIANVSFADFYRGRKLLKSVFDDLNHIHVKMLEIHQVKPVYDNKSIVMHSCRPLVFVILSYAITLDIVIQWDFHKFIWEILYVYLWVGSDQILRQFTTLVVYCGQNLDLLKTTINKIYSDNQNKRLDSILRLYSLLITAYKKINRVYSFRILMLVSAVFVNTLSQSYLSIMGILTLGSGFWRYNLCIFSWTISFLLKLNYLVSVCEDASKQACAFHF
jgi:hypothetical protein